VCHDGHWFDLGGHAFFTSDDDVFGLVDEALRGEWIHVDRRAYVYFEGQIVPYPFQTNLYGLPPNVVEECVIGAVEAASRPRLPAENLDEWLLMEFGHGLYTHFLRRYNERVWAYPLNRIEPTWLHNRAVQAPYREVIRGALAPREFRDFPNARIRYPAVGGFQRIFTELAKRTSAVFCYGAQPKRIDLASRTVTLTNGTSLAYRSLIVTIPIPEFLALSDELANWAPLLRLLQSNSLHLTNLVLQDADVGDLQRLYTADDEVLCHKLAVAQPSEHAAGRSVGIQAETAFSDYRPLKVEDVRDSVLEFLRSVGVFTSRTKLLADHRVQIPRAYPIREVGATPLLEELFAEMRKRGVLFAGRFGRWAYVNSDLALRHGLDAAEQATSDVGTG
jgi:protoporphyrinogen oxidase